MKTLLILIICLLPTKSLFAWGQKGHDVTAYIAECHLTPEAATKVYKVLSGHSPVYYSNWMDIASHTPEYADSRTWHYFNIDEGMTRETMRKNPKGDILTATAELIENLKNGDLDARQEALALKMLIHLVGDMHCPMHVGHLSDAGGNRIPVKMFDTSTNLHSVWDTQLPEAVHRWSYTEWQHQIDRLNKEQIALLQAGEPKDWVDENFEICTYIYEDTPEETIISYDYVDKYTPVIEMQFLRGGYRLAKLLNEIYK